MFWGRQHDAVAFFGGVATSDQTARRYEVQWGKIDSKALCNGSLYYVSSFSASKLPNKVCDF